MLPTNEGTGPLRLPPVTVCSIPEERYATDCRGLPAQCIWPVWELQKYSERVAFNNFWPWYSGNSAWLKRST